MDVLNFPIYKVNLHNFFLTGKMLAAPAEHVVEMSKEMDKVSEEPI